MRWIKKKSERQRKRREWRRDRRWMRMWMKKREKEEVDGKTEATVEIKWNSKKVSGTNSSDIHTLRKKV